MGKKGKKGKVLGTPDVVLFKGTTQYQALVMLITVQESLPFCATDALDEGAFFKVAKFLNALGCVSEITDSGCDKTYRFQR